MSDEFHHIIEELQKRLRKAEESIIRLQEQLGPVRNVVLGMVGIVVTAALVAVLAMLLK